MAECSAAVCSYPRREEATQSENRVEPVRVVFAWVWLVLYMTNKAVGEVTSRF